MKNSTAAWAIQHPNKTIQADMIRAKQTEAISALLERFARHKSPLHWRHFYKVGFRAVRVWVSLTDDGKIADHEQAIPGKVTAPAVVHANSSQA